MDCIDSEMSELLREVSEKGSAIGTSGIINVLGGGPGDAIEARMHWNSCPACRREFPLIPDLIARVGTDLLNEVRQGLSGEHVAFMAQYSKSREASLDSRIDPELIIELVTAGNSVWEYLADAVRFDKGLCQGVPLPDYTRPTFELLPLCHDFFSSLDLGLQRFAVAASLSCDLCWPMFEGTALCSRRFWEQDALNRVTASIKNSGLDLLALVETTFLAAKGFLGPAQVADSGISSSPTQFVGAPPAPLQIAALYDSLDSLKAGQMEIIREIRLSAANNRRASDYEPDIIASMGEALYSRLSAPTRKLLQVAEFLYRVNRDEPNYHHGPVIQMSLAYEHELFLRVFWPTLNALQGAGAHTYDAGGRSWRSALISNGKIQKRTLGELTWYLQEDPDICSKISTAGLDVGEIRKDAKAVLDSCRNKAAHEAVFDQSVADDLRRRILSPNGIFSRLHPVSASAAAV